MKRVLVVLAGCLPARGGTSSCPDDRAIALALQSDIAAFAGCKRAGGVTIRTGATLDVTPLRELEVITGDLVIGPTVGVEEIALSGLAQVGGTVRVASNGALHGVFLPTLEYAGRIEVDGNFELTTLAMPRLSNVPGAVVITDNHDLELLDAASLVRVGDELVIAGQPELATLELGQLASAQTIRIDADPRLPLELVDQLRAKASLVDRTQQLSSPDAGAR